MHQENILSLANPEFICQRLNIPSDSGEYVINGEGVIMCESDKVVIEFETEANIPYAWEFINQSGAVSLEWDEIEAIA